MIAYLRGKVFHQTGSCITLDVAGVGYELVCSTSCLESIAGEDEVQIIVYTDVREDAIKLYGFVDQLEKQVFQLLLKVKGVGAKSASEILSQVDKHDLLRLIGSGDSSRLCTVKGIGKKTAERIVLELKDQVASFATMFDGGLRSAVEKTVPLEDAVEALKALGFVERDAQKACQMAEAAGALQGLRDAGDMVKAVLQFI